MTILFINCTGGGFADRIEVPDGMTVDELFQSKMPGCQAADFLVRVDRQPVAANEVLMPGCRISITPLKIQGAVFPSVA